MKEQPVERDYLLNVTYGEPTLLSIFIEVCDKHGVSANEMRGERKHPIYTQARQEFYYRAKKETTRSYPVIGRFINRDHSTVLKGIKVYEARLEDQQNGATAA